MMDHRRMIHQMGDVRMDNARILIVEDDAITANYFESIMEKVGYTVVGIAPSGEEAIALANSEHPDIVLMDIRLRGRMTGIQAAEQIRLKGDTPVLYITAYTEESLLQAASITQPYGYLVKPVRERELRDYVETALIKAEAENVIK
jgi:CheY-like chemotaxis protein